MSWRTPRENENRSRLDAPNFWISDKSVILAVIRAPQAESGLDPRLKHSGVTALRPSILTELIFQGVAWIFQALRDRLDNQRFEDPEGREKRIKLPISRSIESAQPITRAPIWPHSTVTLLARLRG